MRVKRQNFEHRVRRMRLRANAQRAEAPKAALPLLVRTRPSLNESEPDPQRRSRRVVVGSEIAVRKAGGFSFQLPALDVSTDGCRVELVEMVDVSERVIVRLPGLEPLSAEVIWVGGNKAALQFQRPLHPAVFDQLIDRWAECAA